MKTRSLQFKLLALVLLALGLPLAAALLSLTRVYATAQELDAITRRDFQAQEAVLTATVRFKQQVQEWKDLLLRGQDSAAFDRHWANFQDRERDVDEAVAQARANVTDEDLRTKLDDFDVAHRAMGGAYRSGLEAFKASQFEAQAGDRAVTNIDRLSTQVLLDAEKMARDRGAAAVASAVAAAKTSYTLAIASTVIVVVAALLVAWIFVRRTVVDPIREAMAFAKRIAQGDLTGTIRPRSGDEVGQLQEALAAMNGALTTIVEQMRASAESVAVASGQVVSGTAALSQQTEEQASSLEETAASMEELATTVQQNAENARKADDLARGASSTAQTGGSEVRNVVATMGEITEASRKIADIVAVIDSIAFQTNILALNAAVEAARAGEQGRGFAVVASEVRSLAQRCASAAKEIKGLIDGSARKVEAGAQLVEQAGATIEKLVSGVAQVTDLMSSIAQASREQALGVQQINRTVTEMDKVVQQNASAVTQSAMAAEGMRRQADDMVKAVSAFRVAPSDAAHDAQPPAAHGDGRERQSHRSLAPKLGPAALAFAGAGAEDWKEF